MRHTALSAFSVVALCGVFVAVTAGAELGTVRMQAPAAKAYRLGGRAEALDAVVGFSPEVMKSPGPWGERRRNRARMAFRVYADGKVAAETKCITPRDAAVAIHADLKGADVVVIECIDGGYWLGAPYLKGEWRNLTFSMAGGGVAEEIPAGEFAPQFGILTPPEERAPRINGPDVFGASPGKPVFYRVPVTGEKPLRVSAENVPNGVGFDAGRHLLTGIVEKAGSYSLNLIAENAKGRTTRRFTLAVGDRLAIAPPMGWTSWNALRCNITDANIRETARLIDARGLAEHDTRLDGLAGGAPDDGARGTQLDLRQARCRACHGAGAEGEARRNDAASEGALVVEDLDVERGAEVDGNGRRAVALA